MPKKKPRNIKFKYVFPDDLRDLYVNGVIGGITVHNKIAMHLFSERAPIPYEETHVLTPEGTLGKKIEAIAGGDILRLIQCSVIIEPTIAQAIIIWLQEKLDALAKLKPEQIAKKP